MASSKIDENVMSPSAARSGLIGLSIILASLLWIGGIGGVIGSYLSSQENDVIRYCDGQCICDGGTTDAALMERVCPEGWEQVLARTRHKLRKERRRHRIEQMRRNREAQGEPPPSSLVPSV
jgi:hypothetical protein